LIEPVSGFFRDGLIEAQRRKRLAQALGLPSDALTPEALLTRFALLSAAPPGDLWPVLVDLLRTAVRGATRATPKASAPGARRHPTPLPRDDRGAAASLGRASGA
jgi:hypothetical protein